MYKLILVAFVINTVRCEYKYETKWFTVPLDHFGFQRNESFKIKYLSNEKNWDKDGGPIFVYMGNEAPIEVFAKHTGFMWDIAPEFKAKLVFAEHRYYGESMPFGNKSLDNEHIGYLTAAQALADFADLINYLQGDKQKPTYPVIAFGGSYGGMLAAYFRIKYPHLVTGAIASSAPVHMYPGMIPCEDYFKNVTSSFKIIDENCVNNIRNSWSVLRIFLGSQNNCDWLHKNWNLCDPINTSSDVELLIEFLHSMYETLSMVNYPFATDFALPLPANPVRFVCQFLNETLNGQHLIEAIGKVLQVYSNYDRKEVCINFKKDGMGNIDMTTWHYQAARNWTIMMDTSEKQYRIPKDIVVSSSKPDIFLYSRQLKRVILMEFTVPWVTNIPKDHTIKKCTEMVMPKCTTGQQDMFEPSAWNITKYSEDCHKKYNVYPRPEAARVQYGGDRLQAASNIVFSNGLLDPWTGGGILNSVSASVKAVVMSDAAHHLDLMPSNSADPHSVKMARKIHRQNIEKWIIDFRSEQNESQI